MSQFKLGGVPHHAFKLFHELREKVSGEQGEQWSEALTELLKYGSPKRAQEALRKGRGSVDYF